MDSLRHTKYDAKTGVTSSPINAHISQVNEGDKELYLEMEEKKKEPAQGKEQKKDTIWPDPKVLQKHVQIQDKDSVLTFWEGWMEVQTA